MYRLVFHLSVFLFDVYSMCYDQMYVDIPFPNDELAQWPFKARMMFLTVWCMTLQTLYYAVAVLNDIFGTNEVAPVKVPLIRTAKDTLFSLVFPLALFVVTCFWGVYHVDKDFIYPEFVEKHVPSWLNHSLHTFVLVFILIELYITPKTYPTTKVGFTLNTVFSTSYAVWLHVVYFLTKVWPYPFMDHMGNAERLLAMVASVVSGWVVYAVGEKLNSFVWPVQSKLKKIE